MARERTSREVAGLEKAEVDFDLGPNVDGRAALHTRLEFPLLDGFDGFFVEAHTEAFQDLNVAGSAFRINHNGKQHGAGVLGFAGFFGVFRINFEED